MKRLASGCLATLVLSACATVPPSRAIDRLPPVVVAPPVPPLSSAELVRLAQQGATAEALIGRLKESHSRLRLSASDVLSLKTQGVPLVVLDYLLDSERLANADECTAQINRHDAEAQAVLRQAVQQAELMGWQRCNLATPFPGWVPGPYRYRR